VNKNRLAKPATVAAGFVLLWAAHGLTFGQSVSPAPVQTSTAASSGTHPQKEASPPDDFAGLNYSDQQKAEIEKIRLDTQSRKDRVTKDGTLTPEQKDAMLQGYTRLENSMIFRVLSPEQKREVSQRIRARRAAEQASAHQAAQKKQPPRNQN